VKVGDLVKFKGGSGRLGLILAVRPRSEHFDRRCAEIEWACEYTSRGHYALSLLEVASENR
jgi:hypothetical protein